MVDEIGFCVFFFKQKTAYEMLRSLVGSEMWWSCTITLLAHIAEFSIVKSSGKHDWKVMTELSLWSKPIQSISSLWSNRHGGLGPPVRSLRANLLKPGRIAVRVLMCPLTFLFLYAMSGSLLDWFFSAAVLTSGPDQRDHSFCQR